MMIRIHATSIAINGHGVLIVGASGAGKSDLAFRLIDRGAVLIGDDYTQLAVDNGRLIANAPASIAGQMEVRGVGIVPMPQCANIAIALHIRLGSVVPRLPDAPDAETILGVTLPSFALAGLEASAPIKLELLLARVLEEVA